jgi:L-fuconolactonase
LRDGFTGVTRPPILDSHLHLWRQARLRPGTVLGHPGLHRDFLWTDFERARAGAPVEAVVAVAVDERPGGFDEVAFLRAQAATGARIAAVTAWAPLESPAVRTRLERLGRSAVVRAVRRVTQDEPDPLFCASAGFKRGVATAAELGLACELCVRPGQLDAVVRLADACPQATIVLDHLGKPDLGAAPPARWLRDIDRLARRPNVVCKVSVAVRGPADPPLVLARVAPFVAHVVERFGFGRVLFGSNWPVAAVVIDYPGWLGLLDRVLAGVAPADLARFWVANARGVYAVAD